jgi:hypothetical protein
MTDEDAARSSETDASPPLLAALTQPMRLCGERFECSLASGGEKSCCEGVLAGGFPAMTVDHHDPERLLIQRQERAARPKPPRKTRRR